MLNAAKVSSAYQKQKAKQSGNELQQLKSTAERLEKEVQTMLERIDTGRDNQDL